ncbi:hypothetical protein HZH68_012030 [Vespula germanica]|uniref:Uncharacterized protein n=1 Tax=Vespula germanica TaxID=30212 RepID=A0A834JKF2_VESGE|nr:hypothetical protein HZH68_012030 [Vespula germanica]
MSLMTAEVALLSAHAQRTSCVVAFRVSAVSHHRSHGRAITLFGYVSVSRAQGEEEEQLIAAVVTAVTAVTATAAVVAVVAVVATATFVPAEKRKIWLCSLWRLT